MPPLPKPADQRRRRNAPIANTLKLPKAGRQGPPPAWPYAGKMTKADAGLWAQLWATPAAAAWELNNWTRVVARYVRLLRTTESEMDAPSAALLAEVRQLEDRLGLTPAAMLRLRWEIDGSDDVADARQHRAATPKSTRQRLKAVDPDVVARG